MRGKTIREKRRRANKAALAWAKSEVLRGTALGWNRGEIVHHVLAEVCKRWNISTEDYVKRELNMEWPQSEEEPEEPEFDEESEEIE